MVDEAAYIDPKIMFEVIIPILRVKTTSLICLSSPDDEDNYYSKMINAKRPDGSKIFKTVQAVLICERCKENLPPEEAVKCKHIKHTAHWINDRRTDTFAPLYEDAKLAMREFGGLITSNKMSAFRTCEIERFFSRELTRTLAAPPVIITTADNSGAGSSHLAITSGYFKHGSDEFVVSVCFIFFLLFFILFDDKDRLVSCTTYGHLHRSSSRC